MKPLETGLPPGSAAARGNALPRWPWALLAALLAAKLAVLAGDATLRLFMGDSGSYLHAAITGWTPPDRSFTYGWVVRATALWLASPLALLAAQALAGIGTCLLLAHMLRRRFEARPWLVAVAALLLALEPAQLLYERMVMAESAGTLALVACVALLATYASGARLRWMAAASVAGIVAVSLRFSLLPVVLGLMATVPVVAVLCSRGRWPQPVRLLLHLGFAVLATLATHGAYMQHYGTRLGSEPTYLPARGQMRIGLVAPLVRPAHFEGTGVPASVLSEVKLALDDPTQREGHVWSADGLYGVLSRHAADPQAVARKITSRALRDQPFQLLVLGTGNALDYLDHDARTYRINDDLGRRPPDDGLLAALREHMGYDATGVAGSDSLATRWFSAGAPWLIACYYLLAPLALVMLALCWRGQARAAAGVLCLASLGLVAGQLLFSHVPSLRYLHPMPWFALANLAVIAEMLLRRRADQGPGVAR